MFHVERSDWRTNYARRSTPVENNLVVAGRETSQSSSAGGHLDRRRAVRQAHRVGHRDEYFARSLIALPAVRGADVVHEHEVPTLPRLADGVFLVDLVDQLHDVRADRVAVAEARIERQPVLAVDVHEVLAHLRV